MRRLTFDCIDRGTGRRIGQVPVDLVVESAPTGPVEVIEPANRLTLGRPLTTHPYRVFPLVDHIADKVCTVMAHNFAGGRPSSRVKDLVDLVVIARTQQIDLQQLRVAIATEAALRGLTITEFAIPEGWGRRYRALVAQTPAADGLTDVDAAHDLVAQLIHPALTNPGGPAGAGIDTMAWDPPGGWSPTS